MSKLEFVPGTDYTTKLEISEGGSAIDHVDKSRARQRIQVIGAPSLRDREAPRPERPPPRRPGPATAQVGAEGLPRPRSARFKLAAGAAGTGRGTAPQAEPASEALPVTVDHSRCSSTRRSSRLGKHS